MALGLWGYAEAGQFSYAMQWWFRLGLTGMAFVGAWVAVLLTLMLARGAEQTLRLLLAGVVVGVVLGAVTSLVTLAFPQTLPAMQSFLLGNTTMLSGQACVMLAAVWLLCLSLSCLLSPLLDGLRLGEATAQSLGLQVRPLRILLLAVMGLAVVGAAVVELAVGAAVVGAAVVDLAVVAAVVGAAVGAAVSAAAVGV